MTIEQFMNNNSIKRRKRVEKWIENGYIPNASLENNYIPNSARLPYVEARAKNAKGIYHSIIHATMLRKHVVPELYKISEDEFETYIHNLIDSGVIRIRTEDEVRYYDITYDYINLKEQEIFQTVNNFLNASINTVVTLTVN